MVICYQRSGTFLTKAPALIFEILSPSPAQKDKRTKYGIYEREGVAYYCIVDPENKVAEIYRLHQRRYVKQMDVADKRFVCDIGKCRIKFDFARIWIE